MPDLPLVVARAKGTREMYIYIRKAFTWRLGFGISKSRKFQSHCQKQGNSRCPVGMLSMPLACTASRCGVGAYGIGVLYISAWASALLVLTVMGNARASKCGTSDRHRFPRFFLCRMLLVKEKNTVWKSHATLPLLAKQDLPTFGYNMIDPLKSWCWGAILFYPFKISRFS